MDELVKGMLIALIPALVVSVVTAIITVRLSLSQFHSERWWDKRAEAYSQIMEQLSYLIYYHQAWMDEDLGLSKMSGNKKLELQKRYNKTWEDLTRVAAMGSYIVSADTSAAVEDLLKKSGKTDMEPDFWNMLWNRYTAVQKCIDIVRDDAKKSLGVAKQCILT